MESKGSTILSNSESFIAVEGGNRVLLGKLAGRDGKRCRILLSGNDRVTETEVKAPKFWQSANLQGISDLKHLGDRLRSSHSLNNA